MADQGEEGAPFVSVQPAGAEEALKSVAGSLSPPGKEAFVNVTPDPGATLADLKWEWRAQQQEADELASTRTAGEKWATAVTSLTGVFTAVVLIKGPEDIGEVQGKVGTWLPDWVPDGVWMAGFLALGGFLAWAGWKRVDRWSRKRGLLWLGALVSAALAGLAVGQGLVSWEAIVIVSLGVAVALASLSILAGARAAYGPVVPDPARSGELLRTQERGEVRRSRRWLVAAIYPAVCAVAFIALAITVTWVQTPDTPAPGGKLLVIRENDSPVCGTLVSRRETALLVRRAKQEIAVEIRRDRIRAVTSVASCPGD